MIRSGTVLTWRGRPADVSEAAYFHEIDVSGGASAGTAYSVSLPRRGLLASVQLSPGKDRLAFMLYEWDVNGPTGEGTFWVSGVRGEDMRHVGETSHLRKGSEDGRARGPYQNRGPAEMRWTRDGRGLSFIYKDALWVVPVS